MSYKVTGSGQSGGSAQVYEEPVIDVGIAHISDSTTQAAFPSRPGGGAFGIFLPANPRSGQVITIKDTGADFYQNNANVNPNNGTGTIDGGVSKSLTRSGEAASFLYAGTNGGGQVWFTVADQPEAGAAQYESFLTGHGTMIDPSTERFRVQSGTTLVGVRALEPTYTTQIGLPVGVEEGHTITIKDEAGSFSSCPVQLLGNGFQIEGKTDPLLTDFGALNVDGLSLTLYSANTSWHISQLFTPPSPPPG